MSRDGFDGLTHGERDWVIHSEELWRRAHAIARNHSDVDVADVYHALRMLELPPAARLRRGLDRVRSRPHAR